MTLRQSERAGRFDPSGGEFVQLAGRSSVARYGAHRFAACALPVRYENADPGIRRNITTVQASEHATIAPKSGVHRSAYRMTALILSMRLERRTRQLGLYIVGNPWRTGAAVTAAGISGRARFPTVA